MNRCVLLCLGSVLWPYGMACIEAPVEASLDVADGSLLFPLPDEVDGARSREAAAPSCAPPAAGDAGAADSSEDAPGDIPAEGTARSEEEDVPADVGESDGGQVEDDVPPTPSDGSMKRGGVQPGRAGDVIITEIMANPVVRSDAEGEWIELLNVSGDTVDLEGCSLEDDNGDGPSFNSAFSLEPGRYATVARGDEPGFAPDYVMSITLRNGADALVLSCSGLTIDAVSYDGSAGYPLMPGASLALDPSHLNHLDNDRAESFCNPTRSYGDGELGTPGLANDPCPER